MVKPKYEMLKWSIQNYKMRIKHHEKHGDGKNTMEDKVLLKKAERKKELADK